MKPNITSVNNYLPKDIYINKSDLSEISYILYHIVNRKLDRELDSEALAILYLNKLDIEKKERKENILLRKKLVELYRACIRYKVDCYVACCRFIEFKLSNFIECPDRIPLSSKYKEKEGYWYNKIMRKTGYFEKSCATILDNINISNGTKKHKNHCLNPVEYVYFNFKDEFIDFVNQKYKVLNKHRKSTYTDYSHLAYNNSADDF